MNKVLVHFFFIFFGHFKKKHYLCAGLL